MKNAKKVFHFRFSFFFKKKKSKYIHSLERSKYSIFSDTFKGNAEQTSQSRVSLNLQHLVCVKCPSFQKRTGTCDDFQGIPHMMCSSISKITSHIHVFQQLYVLRSLTSEGATKCLCDCKVLLMNTTLTNFIIAND